MKNKEWEEASQYVMSLDQEDIIIVLNGLIGRGGDAISHMQRNVAALRRLREAAKYGMEDSVSINDIRSFGEMLVFGAVNNNTNIPKLVSAIIAEGKDTRDGEKK